MPWIVEVEETDRIVSVTAEGPMRLVTIKQAAAETFAALAQNGARKIIADDRQMVPQLTTVEIYQLPGVLEGLGLRKTDRVAVVYSDSSPKKADFLFFEDVARNQGFTVQLFTEPLKARAWLKEKH
jgi:hypothetical protein